MRNEFDACTNQTVKDKLGIAINHQSIEWNYQIRLYQEHWYEQTATPLKDITSALNRIANGLESATNSAGHIKIWDGKP